MFRLPPELLVEIFVAACEGSTHSCINRSSDIYPGFTLSFVCSRWREIVIDTPRLWSKMEIIVMNKEDLSPRKIDRIQRFVDFHWERMGSTVPLDFVLHIPSPNSAEFCHPERWTSSSLRQHITPILQRFYVEAHRWRTVSISAFEHQLRLENTKLPQSLPMAENVELCSLYSRQGCSLLEGLSSRIRTLTLSGEWMINENFSKTSFPFLQSLSLQGVIHDSYILHLSPLRLASSLTTVNLCDFCNFQSLSSQERIITCHAKALKITPTCYGDIESTNRALHDLLDKLHLPHIIQLIFSYKMERRSHTSIRSFRFPTQAFFSLLDNRSNPQMITHLVIERFAMETSTLLGIIRKLPFLTHLSVDERCDPCDIRFGHSFPILSSVIFDSLSWSSPLLDPITGQNLKQTTPHPHPQPTSSTCSCSQQIILPRLTEVRFVFHRSWFRHADRKDVWDMLDSRLEVSNPLMCSLSSQAHDPDLLLDGQTSNFNPLKRVEILVPDGSITDRDVERVSKLRMMGLCVSLEEYKPRVVTLGYIPHY
ncbi:hypothetical protein K435DRAFT_968234 [Dendrothele bispora CBS 962.96]|uniref:Uncharacterized protein n=1 Tax=Dendrothele bispora (strain CBS 962.96) TaxID=1314807 RepID=A0A4S8LPP4_DENBC|nr:hypothetical protein K435DRAFT_968234 [Dendrothele bispora CBS 962.96]